MALCRLISVMLVEQTTLLGYSHVVMLITVTRIIIQSRRISGYDKMPGTEHFILKIYPVVLLRFISTQQQQEHLQSISTIQIIHSTIHKHAHTAASFGSV